MPSTCLVLSGKDLRWRPQLEFPSCFISDPCVTAAGTLRPVPVTHCGFQETNGLGCNEKLTFYDNWLVCLCYLFVCAAGLSALYSLIYPLPPMQQVP